ncbi:MAG: glutaminyl-peptide cyclotransferase [Anaerolineae bacterium]|nr:glutaminyl-peptide cyclotransferase [Anaerolineae bacterium]
MNRRLIALLTAAVCALALPALAQEATPETTPPAEATAPPLPYEIFVPQVLNQIPHSVTDFTQGLVWADGRLFQSAGRYGQSRLQELDPETGEVIREAALDDQYFAEGLALVDGRLIQLTWKESAALIWDAETFEPDGEFTYDTEGWGLCYDGEAIFMSDGSPNLFVRDAETFELLETIPVTLEGQPVPQLNELECVDGDVWANVWQTPAIVRIDKTTGEVTGIVDARGLVTQEMAANWANGAVLNGIAFNPETGTFLVTGKDWPVMYEVTFEPAPAGQ